MPLLRARRCGRVHEGAGPCEQWRLADFLAWWRQRRQRQEQQQQQQQGQQQQQQQQDPEACGCQPLWYCKDFHLVGARRRGAVRGRAGSRLQAVLRPGLGWV